MVRSEWLSRGVPSGVVLALLSGSVAPADGRPDRPEQPTPSLMERMVSTAGALERHVDPELGLLLIDYRDGDYRRAQHLCGKALRAAFPDLRRELTEDSRYWTEAIGGELTCSRRTLDCRYDPGEVGGHDGTYLFKRRPDGTLALYAIVRLESGALDRTKHARFAARTLKIYEDARCTDGRSTVPPRRR